jgi:predicted Zn-dependent protease
MAPGYPGGFPPHADTFGGMEERARLVELVDEARKQGARASEVMREVRERRTTASARVKSIRSGETRWRVRVWLDGGRAGHGEANEGAVALQVALAGASAAEPNPLAGPADRMPPITGPMGIDDRRHEGIAESDRAEVLQLAERALAMGGVALRRMEYDEARVVRSLFSSREVELEAGATTYSLAAEGSLGGVTLSHRIASRHFSDVVSLPFGTLLRRRLEALANPGELPSDRLPVVLDPRAMASLVRSMAPAFTATAVAAGSFVAKFLGKRLASAALHLTDDAGQHSGLYTHPFDERGVPPIPIALLKEGVVNGLYHDPETARAAGLRPTGHVGSDGRLAPSNLVVRPGSRTRNVILTALRDYYVVEELPAVNLQTGQVAGPVLVQVVRAGERAGSARARVDVALPALLAMVKEFAADQERAEEVDAPTAVFEGLALLPD